MNLLFRGLPEATFPGSMVAMSDGVQRVEIDRLQAEELERKHDRRQELPAARGR